MLRTNLVVRHLGLISGEGLVINGLPRVTRLGNSRILLGKRVVLNSSWSSNALNLAYPVTLKTMANSALIDIGDDVGISGSIIVARSLIRVGNRVLVGANCVIMDSDQHNLAVAPSERRYAKPLASQSRAVIIGDDVFIGANSMVLKGVNIGEGSIIGAGSVVTSDIPAFTIAAGNPCRIIRPIAALAMTKL